jgi:hypothetical protein
MYTKLSDTTARIELENCTFIFDANSTNFSVMGIDADEEMIAEELTRANIHAQMIADFDDESKLEIFIGLLMSNMATAYSEYINTYLTNGN